MFKLPNPVGAVSEFDQTARALMEQTSRSVIYVTCASWLALQMIVGTFASDALSMSVWATMPILALTAALALRLLSRNLLLAQACWQVGLAAAVTMAVSLFRRPEVALLYIALPFMAVVSTGWPAGALAEALIAVAAAMWMFLPSPLLSPSYWFAIVGGGLFAGSIGWASSRSLYLVTEWSLQSFAQARQNMAEARQHRAQLAQVLQDLDRAYYRLERTNAALVAAWRAAAEAERSKAELATNLSHELRTPLNLIIGFCEMMVTAPQKYGGVVMPREYRSDLNAIYQNARHLMGLVNDVLDLARIDVGRITLSREPVDMAALAVEAADMVREYIEAKGLELRLSLSADLPVLYIDRLRIRQVLLNLLVNAARFTEQGFVELSARSEGDAVRLAVRDTGRGIPEERLPKVFEEYSQDNTGSAQGWPSTGLGLPISKRFVELHGGRMGVESTYGAGSTFWFTMPVRLPEERQEKRPRLIQAEPLRQVAPHKRVIVVVAPEARLLSTAQRYLPDYQVIGAPTLEEAVTMANDLGAVALLAGEGQPPPLGLNEQTLFLACTFPDFRRAAAAVGARDYLTKPISAEELWGAIEAVDGHIRRVLIADDEPDMVRLLRRMLTPRIAPAHCLEAYTGREALNVIRQNKPDLLLLDIKMPDLDGQAVLSAMAQDPQMADIPVILISAHDPNELGVRFGSSLYVSRAGGLSLGELVRGLEANLNALAPEWH
ncbi:MAG: hybrid sensor histidine kinase/response regulator [Chloroflexi bacterium]|nr:hybrid sensor histidine kinase/response regulator [Chloroflexota bacterium]